MPTLLIRRAHVLDLDLPFEPTDLFIDDSRITRIGSELEARADRTIDAQGKVLMPGLINAHTHSGQILQRGFGDRLPLDAWLMAAILAGPPLDARALYVLAAWSALVQLKSGCTACLDHVSGVPFEIIEDGYDGIMQAYLDTGFRAAVAMSLGDLDFVETLPRVDGLAGMPGLGGTPPSAAELLSTAERFLRRWAGNARRVQAYVGPSAPQRCSDELLAGCFALADDYHAGVHSHVLEARSQWFACQERFGMSAVAHLYRKGWLSPRLSCAHSVWLDGPDLQMLAETGAAVVHNPVSNLRLASGIANLQSMLSAGVTVALGADGAASNDGQNMWEVVKLTSILHRVYGERSNWVSAETALRLCLEGGAAVLRQNIGAIKIGHLADLVLLGGPDIFMRPKELMINSLVLGELGQSVQTVIVGGDVVLENGKSTRVDEESLWQEANAIVRASVADLGSQQEFFEARRPYLDRMLSSVEQTPGGPPSVVQPGSPLITT